MQKKLIALAIAGLSGAAFAQSNVTIYGTMDATYDNVSATGATTANTNYQSRGRTTFNSAFIGFKGTEDLGGGLKAVWQVEQSVGENGAAGNIGTTATATTYGLANRDTYIGLAGSWGTLVAGTLTGPTRVVGNKMDVNSGATGIGANAALLGKYGGGNGAGAFDQRISNAIAYISPTWSGFHFAVGYLPNEARGTDAVAQNGQNNTSGWTLGGVYDKGPLFAALTWTQLKDKNGDNTASQMAPNSATVGIPSGPFAGVALTKATNTRAAVKYDFGMATVGLLFDRSTSDVSTSGGVTANQNVWYLPVVFKAGAGRVIAQYGKANNMTGSVMDTGKPGAGKDYSAKHWELGYEHDLSKRTTVKVLWSQITNSADATYDFLYGVTPANANTTTSNTTNKGAPAGADPRGLSVGLRHSF